MAKQVQVIATARGYDNLVVREPGEKFEVSEEVLKNGGGEILEVSKDGIVTRTGKFRPCSWFKAVAAEKQAKDKSDPKKDAGGPDLV